MALYQYSSEILVCDMIITMFRRIYGADSKMLIQREAISTTL